MQRTVIYSGDASFILPYDPFCFSEEKKGPTRFVVGILSGEYEFEYCFAYTGLEIKEETLKIKNKNHGKFKVLFDRRRTEIVNPSAANYGFGQGLIRRTLPKTLLITKAYEDNNPFARKVVSAFDKVIFASFNSKNIERRALRILNDNPTIKAAVAEQISAIDKSIIDIQTSEIRIPDSLLHGMSKSDSEIRKYFLENRPIDARLIKRYGSKIYPQDIEEESAGTKSIISILTLLEYAKEKQMMICIDEFGNFIHPNILARIIKKYREGKLAKQMVVSTQQLDIFIFIERPERVIVRKSQITGETAIVQRRASSNPRKNKEDYDDAKRYFGEKISL